MPGGSAEPLSSGPRPELTLAAPLLLPSAESQTSGHPADYTFTFGTHTHIINSRNKGMGNMHVHSHT